jgi:1-acyl-sn-glycerol-3-phosphate acyltransferase
LALSHSPERPPPLAALDPPQRSSPTRGVVPGGHLLRRLGTGFLFASFGIGSLCLSRAVLPLYLRWRFPEAERTLEVQRIVHRSFNAFIRLGILLGLFSLRESGTNRLRENPGLIVANHPTLLDVVFLISRTPQADCVVKRGAWRNPFLRHIVTLADYIPNDDGPELLKVCLERLRAGRSVILFPEGSRSPEAGVGTFKRGAARLALVAACPVTPVVITCRPPALGKGQHWYQIPDRRLEFGLSVGAPFRAREWVDVDSPPAVATRRLTAKLRHYFEAKLQDART